MPSPKISSPFWAAAAAALGALSLASPALADTDSPITAAPTPTQALVPRQQAGGPGTPILSTLTYSYDALPTQVYPFPVLRGPQFGYNQCGAANATSSADCQTLVFNNASDFCLWGSPDPQGAIGDVEAKVVTYCTDPRWGGRPIPAGAISGVQFMRTEGYIQLVGFIDNEALGLASNDTGGELDPHGADLQGNPLGGVVYSLDPHFSEDGVTPGQVLNWNFFVGSGQFCFKACFNNITSPDYCENRYDLVGCTYNMPNTLPNGTFVDCEGDVQSQVGTYTTNGQTVTWSMPDPLTTQPPYIPFTPSSSQCTTFSSQQLFSNLVGGSTSGSGASPTGGASGGGSAGSGGSGASGASGAKSGSGAGASATGTGAAAASLALPARALVVVLGAALFGGLLLV